MVSDHRCEIGLNGFTVQMWNPDTKNWEDVYARYCPSCGIDLESKQVVIVGYGGLIAK